ncbi:FAD-binding oxidoreductase [Caballeronia sp. TF1N1]|uniref:NAD(P)/FAD-dependent oxidoreductase n=1 Tax=Caballeronia sp. TF1N1 TaxID=2878153 RepID=UPI001FCFB356|nr:FAD-dependent oxidoreductase [Caballeronia sp. TF1N1]
MSADVIVVGAGIVGAACAAELAARGLVVDVVDARGIGGGATAAGMGHIVVMNDSAAEFALTRASRDLWLALAPHLRERDAFVRCGTVWAAEDDEELDAAQTMHDAFAAGGVRAHLLDATGLREAEPSLSHALRGGVLVDDDAIVYAPAAAQWLLTCSEGAARIRVVTGCAVAGVAATDSAASITLRGGERCHAAHVVVANGIAAAELIDGVSLEAKKGHLLITDRYPGTIRHQVAELGYIKSAHHARGVSVAFNAQPRPTGQILIGSSRQFGNVDPAIDARVLALMLRRASRFLPGIGALNAIRAWTGLRAATPDGMPLIGPARYAGDRLWLAAGHEGLGVTTSLGTAALLADQILGAMQAPYSAAFSPQRFAREPVDG